MAALVTTSAPPGRIQLFTNPSNVGGNVSGIPIGLVEFSDSFAVVGGGTPDTMQVILKAVLPRNFVYRINDFSFAIQGASSSDPFDNISADLQGQLLGQTTLGTETTDFNVAKINAFAMRISFGTLNKQNLYSHQDNLRNVIVPALTTTDATFIITYFDVVNDGANYNVVWRVSFHTYTVDALNSWRLNTPTLVHGT